VTTVIQVSLIDNTKIKSENKKEGMKALDVLTILHMAFHAHTPVHNCLSPTLGSKCIY
jgi:hypothetical protein